MKPILGSILAAAVVLQGGIPSLGLDDTLASAIALGLAAFTAGLAFYLKDAGAKPPMPGPLSK